VVSWNHETTTDCGRRFGPWFAAGDSALRRVAVRSSAAWSAFGRAGDDLSGGCQAAGDAPRSVEYWVHRYEREGLGWLTEGDRSGRPRRLNDKQVREINRVLRARPSDAGMRVNLWDGKTLSAWIEKTYGIQLGVRQCQRWFRQLDFRLRKPRPLWARADPARQKIHKKNSAN